MLYYDLLPLVIKKKKIIRITKIKEIMCIITSYSIYIDYEHLYLNIKCVFAILLKSQFVIFDPDLWIKFRYS